MKHFLLQAIFATREDENGWVQILVVVVMAIFYAVANLAKAKKNKAGEVEDKRVADAINLAKQPQRERLRASEQRSIKSLQEMTEQKKGTISESKPFLTAQELMEPLVETGRETARLPREEQFGPVSTPKVIETLIDFDEPEKLRRAVLYYEILGKPLSLRNESEYTNEP